MRFTKPYGSYLSRLVRFAWWLEWLLTGSGWSLGPVSLGVTLVTGELMAHASGWDWVPGYGGLWALHALAGSVLGLVLGYRAVLWLFRNWPGARARPFWLAWRRWAPPAARVSGRWLVQTLYGAVLTVLLLSGLDRLIVEGFGASGLPPFTRGAWMALHGVAAPYLYACLVILLYLRLRRALPAVLAYVLRLD